MAVTGEMFAYYADKGCEVLTLEECMRKKEDKTL